MYPNVQTLETSSQMGFCYKGT